MPGRQTHLPAHERQRLDGALPAMPDIAEVEQEDRDFGHRAVLVQHNGPIMSNQLPAKNSSTQSMIVGTPGTSTSGPMGYQLLGREMKRGRMLIWSSDKPFYYSTSGASFANSLTGTLGLPGAALVPVGVVLELMNTDPVFVACASLTSTDVATVSCVTEPFAD